MSEHPLTNTAHVAETELRLQQIKQIMMPEKWIMSLKHHVTEAQTGTWLFVWVCSSIHMCAFTCRQVVDLMCQCPDTSCQKTNTGVNVNYLFHLYQVRAAQKTQVMVLKSQHPSHTDFHLLPSRMRFYFKPVSEKTTKASKLQQQICLTAHLILPGLCSEATCWLNDYSAVFVSSNRAGWAGWRM